MRWRKVKKYEGYFRISENGLVRGEQRSIMRLSGRLLNLKARLKKSRIDGKGYAVVSLGKNNKMVSYLVHRLVAEAFIPNPNNKPEVNHKDGNKLNNHVSNLEWVTKKENETHALINGLKPYGERVHTAKIEEWDVLVIRKRIRNGETQSVVAKDYGLSQPTVSEIVLRKTWKYL